MDPLFLRKMGVRTVRSGSMLLTRPNREVEQFMDLNFIRLEPNVREWIPRTDHARSYPELVTVLPEQRQGAYLVGKGQSLDYLMPDHFDKEDWPIFCVNESIQIVNPLDLPNPIIFVHQDKNVVIKQMSPGIICLGSPRMMTRVASFENIFYCNDTQRYQGTGAFCIHVIRKLGFKHVRLISFDYLAKGNRRYSTTVERNAITNLSNLQNVTSQLRQALKFINHDFVTPQLSSL